jgi:hypothetical protein
MKLAQFQPFLEHPPYPGGRLHLLANFLRDCHVLVASWELLIAVRDYMGLSFMRMAHRRLRIQHGRSVQD